MPDSTSCYFPYPLPLSSKCFLVDLLFEYSQVARFRYRKLEAPPLDAKSSVHFEDASDLEGVHDTAVESSNTSKRDAPPPDVTTGVQLADASEFTSVSANAVEVKLSGTSKRKAPPPDKTTAVQLADASDFTSEFARVVKHKSSDTSEHDAPPPDSTTGVQLADASELTSVYAGAVENKSSGTSKRKASPSDTTTDTQLADTNEFVRAVKHKSSGTSKPKASPPDTTTGVHLNDARDSKGVYARPVRDKSSGSITGYKYEPRFTPPREEVEDGTTRKFNRLSLGEYYTRDEAKIVLQVARFYYGKDQDCMELENGQFKFSIPSTTEQELGLAGEEKRKWVTKKSKQVYADLGIQKRNFEELSLGELTGARSSHDIELGVSEIPAVSSAITLEVPSCPAPLPPRDVADALEIPSCPPPLLPCGLAEALEVPSCLAPLPPGGVIDDRCETFSGSSNMDVGLPCPDSPNPLPQQSSLNYDMRFFGFGHIHGGRSSPQADGVTQFIQSSIDAPLGPCVDFQQGGNLVGDSGSSFFPELRDPILPCPDSPTFLPQQSSLNYDMRFLGFGQILGGPSSPQTDGASQGIQGSIDAALSPHVDFQQGWDLVGAIRTNFFPEPRDPVLQQLEHHLQQQVEGYALRTVGLEHQLCESQIRNSALQQEIERLTSQFLNDCLI